MGFPVGRDRRPETDDRTESSRPSPVIRRPSLLGVKRLLPWLPFCLAQTAGLQRLNHTQSLFSGASDVQIMHDLVTKNSFRIDNEKSAQRNATVLDQYAVVARDILRRVSGKRIYQAFHATFVARVLIQARCENTESVDTPMMSAPIP